MKSYRNKRESGCGGVVLCINKSYNHNSELIFKSEKTESNYCKINQKGKKKKQSLPCLLL